MTGPNKTQNSPERGGAKVIGGGVSRSAPATMPPPDFHAATLRVLISLDEMAAIFMRLDAEIREMARVGLTETEKKDNADG